jgi:hypothetical protein
MKESASLAYADISPVEDNNSLNLVETSPETLPVGTFESDVFHITTREDVKPRVLVIGRPSRKHTTGYLNIPIGRSVRDRLQEQIVGSLAMGVSGLLEWALEELERKRISLEIQAKP